MFLQGKNPPGLESKGKRPLEAPLMLTYSCCGLVGSDCLVQEVQLQS